MEYAPAGVEMAKDTLPETDSLRDLRCPVSS
eukprot:CAMPEP_0173181352 /NCGR_PEP_ID=MMETSP1141-20130122/7234_1 /TAXON_ID=483371 /ORGANISM="non described non described, Strain CCMP2298" /LENGTH=30 /DNA_ID= /DNA_START= /DNA_END= /DNA_ORIENTATION=